jgi:hypothetical protein
LAVPALRLAAGEEGRLMYRRINPTSRQQLPMRMLFQPLGNGTFLKACEADSFRGLVAAMLDDPAYESGDVEARLVNRLRLADELVLLARIENEPSLLIGDRDADLTINVASDERFIRSLDRLGLVSLEPTLSEGGTRT